LAEQLEAFVVLATIAAGFVVPGFLAAYVRRRKEVHAIGHDQ
jgi:hypothetical protein